MTKSKVVLFSDIEAGLAEIPLLDVHTHIDAAHLSARGLHDILLYHMVISELYSAGCPSGARLSEEPEDGEAEQRLLEAVPFVPRIRNTSIFWGVRVILRDLYGWDEPITPDNWRTLDARIRERYADPSWPRQVLQKTGIRRTVTELWRGREGVADDLLQYSLEWAFMARAQRGQNDIPIFELEKAWNEEIPSPPLPVTLLKRPVMQKVIHSVEDVDLALQHYVDHFPYERVISTAQHISTDLNFRNVSETEMASALKHRTYASLEERDIYASYIFERFLTEFEKRAGNVVFQFSFGAEPLPYESGSKLRQDTIFAVADMIARHPHLQFQALLSSLHANQALCTLVRELPNFSLAGYWWHNFFPNYIRRVISERLDMLPLNRQVGFFSDAYCVEWAYAKVVIVRKQLAHVLAERIADGQYSLYEALSIARAILFETPQTLLGMIPG